MAPRKSAKTDIKVGLFSEIHHPAQIETELLWRRGIDDLDQALWRDHSSVDHGVMVGAYGDEVVEGVIAALGLRYDVVSVDDLVESANAAAMPIPLSGFFTPVNPKFGRPALCSFDASFARFLPALHRACYSSFDLGWGGLKRFVTNPAFGDFLRAAWVFWFARQGDSISISAGRTTELPANCEAPHGFGGSAAVDANKRKPLPFSPGPIVPRHKAPINFRSTTAFA